MFHLLFKDFPGEKGTAMEKNTDGLMKPNGRFSKFGEFFRKLGQDNLSPFAAEVTLFTVISAFPFFMFLFSLLSFLHISNSAFFDFIDKLLPAVILPYVHHFFENYLPKTTGTFTAVTALAALWAGSKGFLGIEKGLNGIYEQAEKRNPFYRRLLSLIYTVMLALFILVLLAVFVFGNLMFDRINSAFPKAVPVIETIRSSRTGITLVILTVFFTTVFRFVPNRRAHKTSIVTELPGALIASFGWVGFSFLYSYYVNHLSNYSAIYGSLTTIVMLLLWLYICIFIMFFGAEINTLLKWYEVHARVLERRAAKKEKRARKRALKKEAGLSEATEAVEAASVAVKISDD